MVKKCLVGTAAQGMPLKEWLSRTTSHKVPLHMRRSRTLGGIWRSRVEFQVIDSI
jgi:hypothetical protein